VSPVRARWILSARDSGARLTEQPAPLPGGSIEGTSALWVDTSRRFQTIEGFGGAFTEAAAVTWQALPAPAREQFLIDCFDPVRGHGYTLGRVHMNSCDFALGNYAHVEQPGDLGLSSFNIERDRQALLPFIKAALQVAGRPVRLLVSPWSPPAWMKTERPVCDYYAATFEHLFRRLVHRDASVAETHCEARGDDACRFELRW